MDARQPGVAAHEAAIREAAEAAGLPARLLRAVVVAESGGRATVVSHADAIGLCQLRLGTAQDEARRLGLGPVTAKDLEDPALNLRLGASYLARQIRRFDGDVALALAAYNAGPVHARRWARRSAHVSGREVVRREAYPETQAYVERVLALAR